jgi:hypothetical protein
VEEVRISRPPVTAGELKGLLGLRLFFGHQSVGYNILDGVQDVFTREGVQGLSVKEGRDFTPTDAPGIRHAVIGENGDPLGKVRDYQSILGGVKVPEFDVAFMKFCYVDFAASTDVHEVFAAYKAAIAALEQRHPKTRFISLTVPLTSRDEGIKARAKLLLGRPVRGYGDNVARESFNALLRAEYGGTGLLFDIALVEAAAPDGGIIKFSMDGKEYYAMQPAYTDDGGHLNARGRVRVAEELLAFLSRLPAR